MDRVEQIVDKVIASTPLEVVAMEKEVPLLHLPLVPDGTGPHGRGMGPGKGQADGSGLNEVAVSPWLRVPIQDVRSEEEFTLGTKEADPMKNLLQYGEGQPIS